MLFALLKTARPHQWVKNLFVAAPLVFALRLDDAHAVTRTVLALACFCLLSSAVYLLNDLVDVEKDRAHPLKRSRPIAAGTLPIPAARAACAGFALVALVGAAALALPFAAVALAYFVLNIAYSFLLKRVAFLDVATISFGFLLRVLGGATAIPVPPSPWLMLVTLLLAGLLGFGKRAHELRVAGATGGARRDVLDSYHPTVLRWLMGSLAVATVAVYGLYTQSAHALGLFQTKLLALTVPFVGFGVARFIWLTNRKNDDESPTESMLRDRLFLANVAGYALTIVIVIYRVR